MGTIKTQVYYKTRKFFLEFKFERQTKEIQINANTNWNALYAKGSILYQWGYIDLFSKYVRKIHWPLGKNFFFINLSSYVIYYTHINAHTPQ